MKPSLRLWAALALTAAIPCGTAIAQHDPAAHTHSATPAPAPAHRWTADADLRTGMGRIQVALAELRHYEMGHMDATMARDRVGLIEQAVAGIFARCKLPPDQDAVLHSMLAPLLGAARAFEVHPGDVAQVEAMRKAVAAYPRYFDDPAWVAASRHEP